MYSLVVLLSTIVCATFVGAFVQRRGRRWTVAFALSYATLLYTHNWGLFLGAALAFAFVVFVRQWREGLLAAGIVLAAYAPWLPTLAFQIAHTGAPWANPPDLESLEKAPQELLGYTGQFVLLLAGGYGLSTLPGGHRDRRAAVPLAAAAAVAILVPWLLSQASPAWATRYLAVAVAPLLLLAAAGMARAAGLGVAALAVIALVWIGTDMPSTKSNVHSVTAAVAPSLEDGDTVISTQPEQVPVLRYYLRDLDLRYATITGPVADLGVTDWRDGTERLERTSIAEDLEPVLREVPVEGRVALVVPDFGILGRWKAPWTELVRTRSLAWEDAMRRDPRFRVITIEPPNPVARPNEVRATVFARR